MADLLSAQVIPCFVDGKAFTGQNSYQVVDPHNPAKTLHTVSSVSEADVVKVLESAHKAFPAWKAVGDLLLCDPPPLLDADPLSFCYRPPCSSVAESSSKLLPYSVSEFSNMPRLSSR